MKDLPVGDGRPGRVVVDNRGRNVWQWARSALDSTTVLLKRLENSELALEPTQRVPVVPDAAKPEAPARGKAVAKPADGRTRRSENPAEPARGARRRGDAGGGFDPYNSR